MSADSGYNLELMSMESGYNLRTDVNGEWLEFVIFTESIPDIQLLPQILFKTKRAEFLITILM